MGKFFIEPDGERFKFYLKALNGETVATGKSHINRRACVKAIESVVKNVRCAGFLNLATGEAAVRAVPNPKFEMYINESGEYMFILKARNGEIILLSGLYKSKQGCLNGIESVRKNAAEYEIAE